MANDTDTNLKLPDEADDGIDLEEGLEKIMDSANEAESLFGNKDPAALGAGPVLEIEPDNESGPDDLEKPVEALEEVATEPAEPAVTESSPELPGEPPAPATTEDITDALFQFTDALHRLVEVLPAWVGLVAVAVVAVLFGLMIGARVGRRTSDPAPARAPASDPPVTRRALPAPESPVFVKYQEFLEQKGVQAKEFDSQVRAFAERYKEMRQNLRDLMPGDRSLEDAVEEVRETLDKGDFDHALGLLSDIGKRENADGVEKHNAARKHLMAAAISKSIAGDLQMARMAYGEAAGFYRDAIAALPDFQQDMHAEYLNKYGTASYQSGEHQTAIAAFERALSILERKLGKNHPDVATALNNLALLHYSRGNYDAAQPLYERSLSIDEHTLGIDHPGVATDLNNLALLHKKKGNLESAEPLMKRALAIKEKHFDPGHPSLVTGLKNHASLLRALGREEEAGVYERKATVLPPKRTDAAAE